MSLRATVSACRAFPLHRADSNSCITHKGCFCSSRQLCVMCHSHWHHAYGMIPYHDDHSMIKSFDVLTITDDDSTVVVASLA